MRVVDEQGNNVTEPDLNYGYLIEHQVLRDGVEPIDNEVKFAYADDDWEDVLLYVSVPVSKKIEAEIVDLRHKLADTDYIASKLMDALVSCTSLSGILKELAAFNAEYADYLKNRQSWRDRINELENERKEEA